ncbi:MAG: ABC transporter ATP-binding protein [Thermoanaerobaculia bacterium]
MGAHVVLSSVSKSYGVAGAGDRAARVVALEDFSLELASGSFTALVGPSGCGKSTLLNLLGALDRPGSGSVVVDGRDLATLTEGERDLYRRRTAGTIFQFFNLLPTMTALENVALPLLLSDVAPKEADARAAAGLAQVEMHERLGAYPYELSGGQMQRVAVARALVHEPGLILADEPTGNLDSRTGAQVLELLAGLSRARGITVVMATHSSEAAAYAGQVVRMKDGRLA